MKQNFILFLLMLVIAIREGFLLKWALNNRPEDLSKLWHRLGSVMRALPLVLILWFVWGQWMLMGLIALFWANWAWSVYDLAINIINDWRWFGSGKTSGVEKTFNVRLIWIGKGILFIGTVVFSFFYFFMS